MATFESEAAMMEFWKNWCGPARDEEWKQLPVRLVALILEVVPQEEIAKVFPHPDETSGICALVKAGISLEELETLAKINRRQSLWMLYGEGPHNAYELALMFHSRNRAFPTSRKSLQKFLQRMNRIAKIRAQKFSVIGNCFPDEIGRFKVLKTEGDFRETASKFSNCLYWHYWMTNAKSKYLILYCEDQGELVSWDTRSRRVFEYALDFEDVDRGDEIGDTLVEAISDEVRCLINNL
jgi:hypothetical protein